ncbi:JAB domain-containing protein [Empedobacter brevis]|uniref:JAB domain-containing protein n=1 Tax=Empedobacter brevis TaxID=247 RepID=UPI0028AF058C|nr:JAB domain-containing protein [Empedobacter brevis]
MRVSEIKISYTNKTENAVKVTSSSDAYKVALSHWDDDLIELQEEVKILLLNRGSKVLGIKELFKGGISTCVIDVRLLMAVVLKTNATGIIIYHNHPSGSLVPSLADKNITQKIKDCCKLFDVDVLDHLIITKNAYFSFADDGII